MGNVQSNTEHQGTIPWAWYLLSVLSFGLNVTCAGVNDYRMHGGEGQDPSVWKWARRRNTRESSTGCSEDSPLLLHSALRNGRVVCHSVGGTGGECLDLYEWSSWKLCWWYLEIHLLLTLRCYNCPVREQKNILSLVINFQVNMMRCPRAVLELNFNCSKRWGRKGLEGEEQYFKWLEIGALTSNKNEAIPMTNIFFCKINLISCNTKQKSKINGKTNRAF